MKAATRTGSLAATGFVLASGGIFFALTGAGMAVDEGLALVVALAIVGACVFFGVRHSERVTRGTQNRGIRLTAAFRSIASRMGLEDPWPGRRADETPQAGELGYPALRGTYKNHRVNVLVHADAGNVDQYTDDNFIVIVRAPRGSRWPKAGRIDRGAAPAGLSPAAQQALEQLRARKLRDRAVLAIALAPDELTCIVDDRLSNAVSLEEARAGRALPHPTELEAILDELVTLASGLPRG